MQSPSAADRQELTQAFRAFNALSDQLKASYVALEQRVAALTAELEVARREREREATHARRLAERLKLLLDTLPAGVVVIDAGGAVSETNPAAETILGGRRSGESWPDVARSVFRQQLTAHGDWVRHDGRQVSMLISTLAEEQTKVVVMTDVTETRAIEHLVHRNERLSAMGEMAASLAHQIRTPLAGALLYVSQCQNRSRDARETDLLGRGLERLRYLDRLVQDMLVFARGHGPGERVRVADLFRDVHEAVCGIKPANAHLVVDGRDALVELDGNRTALTAALINLVRNALESAPAVVVTMRAEQRGARLRFIVSDNGPGIDLELQSRIFEPFFSTRPTGTGLGLAVVKTVTEAHGGEVEIESNPEHGTCIGLDLPREAAGPAAVAKEVA